jgi:hypothetical protein
LLVSVVSVAGRAFLSSFLSLGGSWLRQLDSAGLPHSIRPITARERPRKSGLPPSYFITLEAYLSDHLALLFNPMGYVQSMHASHVKTNKLSYKTKVSGSSTPLLPDAADVFGRPPSESPISDEIEKFQNQ